MSNAHSEVDVRSEVAPGDEHLEGSVAQRVIGYLVGLGLRRGRGRSLGGVPQEGPGTGPVPAVLRYLSPRTRLLVCLSSADLCYRERLATA